LIDRDRTKFESKKLEMGYRKGKITLLKIFIHRHRKSIDGFVNETELNGGI